MRSRVTAAMACVCVAGCAAEADRPRANRDAADEAAMSFGNGLGHIAYAIDRRADDLRRLGVLDTTAIGKGAVNCDTGQIVVWSMGMPVGRLEGGFEICPPRRTPSRAIVACAWRPG